MEAEIHLARASEEHLQSGQYNPDEDSCSGRRVSHEKIDRCLTQHFRCPEKYASFALRGAPGPANGFFLFGEGATCYGSCSGHQPADLPDQPLHDALHDVAIESGTAYLPFDPSAVVENLCRELYTGEWRRGISSTLAKLYYLARPALPVGLRKHLQRFHLRNWEKLPFPQWPVDCSVENLREQMMALSLRTSGAEKIPFIWFWPDGKSSCAIMTHDVETESGRDFCPALMDIDDSMEIKSSFQIIPEERYAIPPAFLPSIRRRGFEVVVHDLNHDGHLYKSREQFVARGSKINSYGKQYGACGFRAGVLYRRQLWYDALKFSYDMSIPNVAHLDPQRGGCCTVMPYFIGDILELPVTTVQDYTLFNILNDYSISLWKQQAEIIMAKHGMMSFIVHPDYILEPREMAIYKALLDHLTHLRKEQGVWITTPGEVDLWWRQRAKMRLIETDDGWRISGPGNARARVAYASEKGGQIILTLETPSERKEFQPTPS